MSFEGVRKADEGIYLKEDRTRNPKEVHKFLVSVIKSEMKPDYKSIHDMGCATGELLYHFDDVIPGLSLSGSDVSPELIDRAKENLPAADFKVASALDAQAFEPGRYDLVASCGVLCIFDDPFPALKNIHSSLKPGGKSFVMLSFNDDPVDVIMRYRRADGETWETGWNAFSKETFTRMWKKLDPGGDVKFVDFKMPISVAKQADPMRSWTVPTANGGHQIVNGAMQLINFKVMVATKSTIN